ncbi:MAG: DNA polymerase III subunit beta [Acidobacteriota bacterium]|jgi:DNA polymerase III subunit beta
MDLTIRKGELLKELQYVQGVVERKTTVPILSNLLLETTGNSLLITATDLDVTLRCSCHAEVKVSGAFTVSARKLFDIVRLLPEADIHFKSASAEWIQVVCQRSKFKIAGLSKENFPEIPTVKGDSLNLPGHALRYMIPRCVFAITQEESRYTLNGALLIVRPGGITFVTTDGHRLAFLSHACEIEGADSESRVLVPKKTLVELSKLVAEDVETITFGHSENHLFFKVADRLLVSRILSGQFPNFEMVIPKDNERRARAVTLDLVDALRRSAVMADELSRAVRFSLKTDQLELSAASADVGESSESIPIEYQDDPMEIGFNAYYMLDFLTTLESEKVDLWLKDRETQGLLKPGEAGEFEYSYVIMPMKI